MLRLNSIAASLVLMSAVLLNSLCPQMASADVMLRDAVVRSHGHKFAKPKTRFAADTSSGITSSVFPGVGPFGLSIHEQYVGPADHSINVEWVRLDAGWKQVEKGPAKGQYDWASYDKYFDYYLSRNFHVICILNVATMNPMYQSDFADKDATIADITTWAGVMANRYKGRGIVWEIGNEPEVFPMNGYWNDPATYTKMAVSVAKAIKAADPTSHIAAPSPGWMDKNFIAACFKDGLLTDGNIDVVSYHGYDRWNIMAESGIVQDDAWLRQEIKQYGGGNHYTIADTERGYGILPFGAQKPWGNALNMVYTESEQAAYLARHYFESIHDDVELINWYVDAGESNFGIWYVSSANPKGMRPSGYVYRNMAALLPDNVYSEHNDSYDVSVSGNGSSKIIIRSYLRKFANGRKQLIVALWNPVESFDGKTLESRVHQGNYAVEQWRDATPSDHATVPVQVTISGLSPSLLKGFSSYNLTAASPPAALAKAHYSQQGGSIVSDTISVGPMPSVLIADISPSK